ncbi:hypothetical protein GCM10017778_63760 [Streptomyces vinaceus]|nr:hypothetical protein GCM10017778_63760 [Streptomyces vinaceus]
MEEFRVEGREFGARIGAEGFGEGVAGALVRGEGVGRAAARAERPELLGAQGLVVRVLPDQRLDLRQERRRVGGPAAEFGLDPGAEGGSAVGFGRGGVGGTGGLGEVGEGGAAPEGEGGVEGFGGGGGVGGQLPGALAGEPGETVQVDVVAVRDGQAVAAGGVGEDRFPAAEGAAEPGDEGLEGGGGVLGRGVAPDVVDEVDDGGGGRAADAEREGGEERAQAGAADGEGGAGLVARLGDAKDEIPHRAILPCRCRGCRRVCARPRAGRRPPPGLGPASLCRKYTAGPELPPSRLGGPPVSGCRPTRCRRPAGARRRTPRLEPRGPSTGRRWASGAPLDACAPAGARLARRRKSPGPEPHGARIEGPLVGPERICPGSAAQVPNRADGRRRARLPVAVDAAAELDMPGGGKRPPAAPPRVSGLEHRHHPHPRAGAAPLPAGAASAGTAGRCRGAARGPRRPGRPAGTSALPERRVGRAVPRRCRRAASTGTAGRCRAVAGARVGRGSGRDLGVD